MNVIAFYRHAVGRLRDLHRSMRAQQIHQQAVVARIEVLHNQERHTVIRRQRVQQFLAGFESASRGADCDDRKVRAVPRLERTSNPTRARLLGGLRTTS